MQAPGRRRVSSDHSSAWESKERVAAPVGDIHSGADVIRVCPIVKKNVPIGGEAPDVHADGGTRLAGNKARDTNASSDNEHGAKYKFLDSHIANHQSTPIYTNRLHFE